MKKVYRGGYGENRKDWPLPLRAYDWHGLLAAERYYAIIFDHEFAKAFWGRKVIDNDFADEEGCSDPYVCDLHCGEAWEYHLQRMVISDDPLKYLEKFLDK